VNHKQAAFVAITKRANDDSINNGKDGSVCANSYCERDDCDGTEERIASEGTNGIAEIITQAHGELQTD
jgi:hypothetical protein